MTGVDVLPAGASVVALGPGRWMGVGVSAAANSRAAVAAAAEQALAGRTAALLVVSGDAARDPAELRACRQSPQRSPRASALPRLSSARCSATATSRTPTSSAWSRPLTAGRDLDRIRAVASLLIAQVDDEVDAQLTTLDNPGALVLKGKAAIANAQLAYELHEQVITSDRWQHLAAVDGRPQRPLWVVRLGQGLPHSPDRDRPGLQRRHCHHRRDQPGGWLLCLGTLCGSLHRNNC